MRFDFFSLGDHLPDPHIGAFHESQAGRHRMWVDLGVHAETLGFSGVFFGEHHGSSYVLSSPQMLLAAVAARTTRVRLGTAVSLLPTNDPVRLAEDFATLDLISDGRAEIGLGAGITEHTFRLFGHPVEHAAELSAEHLDLLQRLWTEPRVTWAGRRRPPFEDFELQPRTAAGRPIPIHRATATSLATAEAAGRAGHRLMVMTIVGSFADARPLAETYRAAYRAAGHDPAGMGVTAVAYVHVQADGARARANTGRRFFATTGRSWAASPSPRAPPRGSGPSPPPIPAWTRWPRARPTSWATPPRWRTRSAPPTPRPAASTTCSATSTSAASATPRPPPPCRCSPTR